MLDEISLTFVVILRLPDERSEAQGSCSHTTIHPSPTESSLLLNLSRVAPYSLLWMALPSLFFFFLKGSQFKIPIPGVENTYDGNPRRI